MNARVASLYYARSTLLLYTLRYKLHECFIETFKECILRVACCAATVLQTLLFSGACAPNAWRHSLKYCCFLPCAWCEQRAKAAQAERSRRKKAREVFDMFDADGSRTISITEMKASLGHLEYNSFHRNAVLLHRPLSFKISFGQHMCVVPSLPVFLQSCACFQVCTGSYVKTMRNRALRSCVWL